MKDQLCGYSYLRYALFPLDDELSNVSNLNQVQSRKILLPRYFSVRGEELD